MIGLVLEDSLTIQTEEDNKRSFSSFLAFRTFRHSSRLKTRLRPNHRRKEIKVNKHDESNCRTSFLGTENEANSTETSRSTVSRVGGDDDVTVM